MKLSTLPAELELEVQRDFEFENLGFLFGPLPMRLVFMESAELAENVVRETEISCVITSPRLAHLVDKVPGLAVTKNPRLSFFRIHNYLATETEFYGPSVPNKIDPSARIHPRAAIADSDVVIGPDCEIGANVWIGRRVTLEARVKIHPGTSLGGIGCQAYHIGNEVIEMVHAGGLVLEEDVLVMANAVIARAVFREATRIGARSRVCNLAFISHNSRIGTNCCVAHHAVVNGNVVIGDEVWVGPNATIANNLTLGNRAKVSLGSAVTRDVASGQRVTGALAVEHQRMLRHLATFAGPIPHRSNGRD